VEESSQTTTAARLTARGAKTRSRIVATAADLMRVRGVGGTTLDDVVLASNVSKSQLYRHFADKPALVRAVIEFVGEQTVTGERERLEKVRTFAGLRRWRDALVEHNALQDGRYGCALGSLANEVSDQDSVARRKLHDLFRAWQELFEDLLRRFQQEGVIPRDADVAQLATGFVAAVQGGYLLAQTSRDVTPMASAIDMAIKLENVGIAVRDLEATIAFFADLGLTVLGRDTVSGDWTDTAVGLDGNHAKIAMLQTPDGTGRLELFEYIHPEAIETEPTRPNEIGMHRVAFSVDDIDVALEIAARHGCHPLRGVATYQDVYKLTYVRGPSGILVMFAEELKKD
jgi:glyoxylase I family protein